MKFELAMKKFTLLLLVMTLTGAGVAWSQYQVGDVVEDFSLPDLQGQEVTLYSHLGQIVVLNFFTTWCPGCNEEAAHLEQDLHQAYGDQGVAVVAVSIQEQLPLVQGWAAAQEVSYQILLAPDWDLFQLFPFALSIPYNAVLGPDMTIRYALPGFSLDEITDTIEEILAEGQVGMEKVDFGYMKSLFKE